MLAGRQKAYLINGNLVYHAFYIFRLYIVFDMDNKRKAHMLQLTLLKNIPKIKSFLKKTEKHSDTC